MLAGKAVMVNWSDVAPENRHAYYEWHSCEHMLGRVALPGFVRGRRYIAAQASRGNASEVRCRASSASRPASASKRSVSAQPPVPIPSEACTRASARALFLTKGVVRWVSALGALALSR